MKTLLIITLLLVIVWILYGYYGSRVKEPKFTVLEKKNGYEIREYSKYIEAQTIVSGTYRETMSTGFRILAGYIFGGNTKKQSIAMTAPVVEQKSESISMTVPVLETVIGTDSRILAFVMPEGYTLDSLPTPNDTRIKLVEVPSHTSAVLRYSGYTNSKKVEEMKVKLLEYLKRDGIEATLPRGAGYNPPWTPPFMMRNEILVDINK